MTNTTGRAAPGRRTSGTADVILVAGLITVAVLAAVSGLQKAPGPATEIDAALVAATNTLAAFSFAAAVFFAWRAASRRWLAR
jgi:uncharacterized membrane protein YozB (DUF420 family)